MPPTQQFWLQKKGKEAKQDWKRVRLSKKWIKNSIFAFKRAKSEILLFDKCDIIVMKTKQLISVLYATEREVEGKEERGKDSDGRLM